MMIVIINQMFRKEVRRHKNDKYIIPKLFVFVTECCCDKFVRFSVVDEQFEIIPHLANSRKQEDNMMYLRKRERKRDSDNRQTKTTMTTKKSNQ
jgi:hypothetical protein